jgi:long-chain acyl-CoA synthetase
MNLAEWLMQSAHLFPKAPALLQSDHVVADYATFAARAASIAGTLRDQYRIKPGDRVAVFMKNRTEYLEVLYAIWFIGSVAAPINAKRHAKEAA